MPDKLAQFSHIHRSLPPLTSAAFVHDCLSTTAGLRAVWLSSPRLQHLLSGVRAVLFRDMHVALRAEGVDGQGWAAPPDRPAYPLVWPAASAQLSPSPRSFALVQTMALTMRLPVDDDSAVNRMSRALFHAGEACYPQLHTLHLELFQGREAQNAVVKRAFLDPLLHLPSLHTLRLNTSHDVLDWSAFRLLLSLPLTHLDCSGSWLVGDFKAEWSQVDTEGSGASQPITHTWKVLKLPLIETEAGQAALLDVLLQQYMVGEQSSRRGELQHIEASEVDTRDEIATLSQLSTLRSLEIKTSLRFDPCDLQPLCTTPLLSSSIASPPASSASSSNHSVSQLPLLRHLFVHCDIPDDYDYAQPDIFIAAQQYVDLVTCYSATLVCLVLHDIPYFCSCRPLLQAVFDCTKLKRCGLRALPNSAFAPLFDMLPADASASPWSLPSLPRLHTLTVALPLSAAELAAVLSACPAVEDLSLDVDATNYGQGETAAPLRQLELVGQACTRVRRLEICTCTPTMGASTDRQSSWGSRSSPATQPSFNQLSCLHFGANQRDHRQAQVSGEDVIELVDMLRLAPLQYLELWYLTFHHIHHLSSLSHLRGLRLSLSLSSAASSLPSPMRAQYFSPLTARYDVSSDDLMHARSRTRSSWWWARAPAPT